MYGVELGVPGKLETTGKFAIKVDRIGKEGMYLRDVSNFRDYLPHIPITFVVSTMSQLPFYMTPIATGDLYGFVNGEGKEGGGVTASPSRQEYNKRAQGKDALSVYFQCLVGIFTTQLAVGGSHNDTHEGNFLVF